MFRVSVLLLGLMITLGSAMAQNTNNYRIPYAADDKTAFLFDFDSDNGTANLVPNLGPSQWNAWATDVIIDPGSQRFSTDIPLDGFGKSVYTTGVSWTRVSTLVTAQATIDTYENYTNQITLEAWIKPAATGGLQRVISRAATYFLYLNNDEVEAWFAFADGTADPAIGLATTDANLQNGQWYHIAGMWDGSEISIWINGVKVKTAPYTRGNLRKPATSNWFLIASAPWDGENFKGNIDEVRVSTIARTGLVPVELSAFDAN